MPRDSRPSEPGCSQWLLARQHGLPIEQIGTVGGDRVVVELAGAGPTGAAEERGSKVADAIDVPIADLERAWEHGLPRALGWDGPEHATAHAAATAEGR